MLFKQNSNTLREGYNRHTIAMDTQIHDKLVEVQSKILSESGSHSSFSKINNALAVAGLLSMEKLNHDELSIVQSILQGQSFRLNSDAKSGVSRLVEISKKQRRDIQPLAY